MKYVLSLFHNSTVEFCVRVKGKNLLLQHRIDLKQQYPPDIDPLRVLEIPGGGGNTFLYKPYRYVLPSSGRVFGPFWSEDGYTLCPFWSEIGNGMDFRGQV